MMDIVKLIDCLHAKCSSGNGSISTKLFKLMKDAIVELLRLIINQTCVHGTFPDNLKIAKVIPIFKKTRKHFSQTIGQFPYYLPSQKFLKTLFLN